MKKNVIFRVIYGVLVVIAIFVLPWWMASIPAIFGLFLFGSFYEIFLFALIMDSLYGSATGSFISANLFSVFAVVLFLISFPIKTRFSF